MRRTAAALLLLAASPAAASTFLATTVEELTRSSEAVVRGRVIAAEARHARDGRIVTDVQVEVASAWKGEPGRTVALTVPGGQVGDLALRVEGGATFAQGEEVVVFAVREGARWTVASHGLGKYRVTGTQVRPDVGGARIVPRAIPAGERLAGEMTVAELERRVRAAR